MTLPFITSFAFKMLFSILIVFIVWNCNCQSLIDRLNGMYNFCTLLPFPKIQQMISSSPIQFYMCSFSFNSLLVPSNNVTEQGSTAPGAQTSSCLLPFGNWAT